MAELHERVGVFGGTFDPVHLGHLIMAAELGDALGLERIIFVPAGQPPHKSAQIVTADEHRLAMLRLAIAGNPHFELSTIELDRPGPSYTADLLATLREQLPDAVLVFLMGEDSLRDLPTWRDPAAIVRLAEIGVAMRPDVEADLSGVHRALPGSRDRIHVVPTTQIGISSSGLRRRIRDQRTIRYQVPEAVERYIADHALYREPSATR